MPNKWLTPDTPPSSFACRRLLIPDAVDFLAIVAGALNPLIYEDSFEPYGSATPAQTAAIFRTVFDDYSLNGSCKMIGEIVCYAGSTPPVLEWLECDGASLLRTDFPDLFTVIGTVYGAADGTHFNLPDLRGRVQVGVGSGSGLTPRALGSTFGEENHVLTTAESASHTHIDAGHTHVEGNAVPAVGAAIVGVPIPSAVPTVGVTGSGSANIGSSGGGGGHNTMQPSLALTFFIVALP